MCALLKPNAAKVPRAVDKRVEKTAIITPFFTAPCQFKFVKKSWYHFVEYPPGSSASISGVNVKYGTALKDRGMITTSGAIKKKKTPPHSTRKV